MQMNGFEIDLDAICILLLAALATALSIRDGAVREGIILFGLVFLCGVAYQLLSVFLSDGLKIPIFGLICIIVLGTWAFLHLRSK